MFGLALALAGPAFLPDHERRSDVSGQLRRTIPRDHMLGPCPWLSLKLELSGDGGNGTTSVLTAAQRALQ